MKSINVTIAHSSECVVCHLLWLKMAASRVDSSGSRTRRLCVRYRKFFIAAGVTLGFQLFLCHSFLHINLRAGDSDIYKKDGSGKVPFSKKDNEEVSV